MDLAVAENSQNPVYYVQYAHARICSIIKNLAAENINADFSADGALLATAEERALIKHLGSFSEEIVQSAKCYDPARITRYAIDLATLFHKFYNACRVKGEEEKLMQSRLSVCHAAKTVIYNVLKLLKVSAPESM